MKLATWPWRGVRGLCWLLTHPPTGRHVRKLLGLIFLVIARERSLAIEYSALAPAPGGTARGRL